MFIFMCVCLCVCVRACVSTVLRYSSTMTLISVYIAANGSIISELERGWIVLWPYQCNIQELAGTEILKLTFSAVDVIDTYRVIGGIIHSFLNLAFLRYKWWILRPGLIDSYAKNRIYLEEEAEWHCMFWRREMSRVPTCIQTPNRRARILVTIHTELYRLYFREVLSKKTHSRRRPAYRTSWIPD